MCVSMRVDMCVEMCMDMTVDLSIDMQVDMCMIDTCMLSYIKYSAGMYAGMCIELVEAVGLLRNVCGHACRHVCVHMQIRTDMRN